MRNIATALGNEANVNEVLLGREGNYSMKPTRGIFVSRTDFVSSTSLSTGSLRRKKLYSRSIVSIQILTEATPRKAMVPISSITASPSG